MRKFILFGCLLFSVGSGAQFCFFPSEAELTFDASMKIIKTDHQRWVRSTADKVRGGSLESAAVTAEATKYGSLSGLAGSDIESLVFLVMMQAAKAANEDLRSLLDEMKKKNAERKKMREALNALRSGNKIRYNTQLDSLKRASGLVKPDARPIRAVALKPVAQADIDAARAELESELDSLSEMGEMESLRLQMYMDRLSKVMSTLSNVMKKISMTADQITQNLK